MKIPRRVSLSIICLTALVFAFCGNGTSSANSGIGEFESKPVYIAANPAKGFNYGYYYYIPQSIRNVSRKFLLVEPNNTGTASDDMAVHDAAAKNTMSYMIPLADRLGCALLVPVFERPKSNWLMYTHALNRLTLQNNSGKLARVDLQLIKMIGDVKAICENIGINLQSKFLMDGFSASGKFVNRFAAIHPELVQAVVAGGMNCMPILPAETMQGERLIYPVGIADIGEITGLPFNLSQFAKVPQFIFMGAKDTNDTLPYSDAFGEQERALIIKVLGRDMWDRWEPSKRVYIEQNCAVKFMTYEGVGHEYTSKIIEDIIAFLRENMR